MSIVADRAIVRALLVVSAIIALVASGLLSARAETPATGPPGTASERADAPDEDPILAQDPNLTHIGAPVTTRHVRNTLVALEDGHPMYYAVFRGEGLTDAPATFVVADALSGDIVRTFPLSGADTSMELRANEDRSKIYFVTTTDNNLYEYDTGTAELRKIGLVNPGSPGDGNVWSLTAAEDGKMYMGSYPNALLYLYDPADDSIENLGRLDDTQSYVYTLAYDFDTGNLYAASGGVAAQVWKIGPDGSQKALLNEENAPGATTSQFISTFTFVNGLLFARGDNSSLLVIDRDDEVQYWTGAGREAFGYQVAANPVEEGKFVMTTPDGLAEYDANSHTIHDLGLSGHGVLNDSLWLELDDPQFPGLTMVAATNVGATLYNPQAATSTSFPVEYENPVTVQKILNGPGGSIYASGYPTGLTWIGNEPGEFGETVQSGQFESAVVRDGKILLGAYGYGKLMEFDPATGATPRQIFDLRVEDQDRPFGLSYDEANDRVFMATVPYYGTNQGALTVYDFQTEEKKVYTDEIVEEQSVIDVLYHDGLVYLGTTIDGGLSAPPSGQMEARFIVFDPDTGSIVDDIIPVAGDEGVTGLMLGPDDLVWGVSEDTIFKYDPELGEIVYSEVMLGARYGSSTVWAWAYLAIGADGNVYGSNRSSLFKIDPETMEYTRIVEGAGNYLKVDGNGDVYFSSGVNVYKYNVPDSASVELVGAIDGEEIAAGTSKSVQVTVNGADTDFVAADLRDEDGEIVIDLGEITLVDNRVDLEFTVPDLVGSDLTLTVTAGPSAEQVAFSVVEPYQAPQPPFTDVPFGIEHYESMAWMKDTGISTGWADGTYRPLEPVNRDAMAAFLHRLAGEPEVDLPETSPFTDVAAGDQHYEAIVWASQNGITTGWADGTFRPTQPIKRDAMAAFVHRYAGAPDYEAPTTSPFEDVPTSDLFYEEMTWMHDRELATGWADGTYRPLQPTNRDATAAFLFRMAHNENIVWVSLEQG